jgi:chromate transporter
VDETTKPTQTRGRDRADTLRLFWIFLKAGTFTFAGGLAMLPLIQKDVIDKYRMMDEETFLDYAALSQTLPGIIALNCAVFVGKKVAGMVGALAAGFGTILPAFVLMLVATVLVDSIPRTETVERVFAGVRSASAALILYSAIKLGKKSFQKLFSVVLILLSFVIVLFFRVSAFWVILGAAAAGLAVKLAKPGDDPGAKSGGKGGEAG